jgi:FtsZ-interacting cell division protein ZipA
MRRSKLIVWGIIAVLGIVIFLLIITNRKKEAKLFTSKVWKELFHQNEDRKRKLHDLVQKHEITKEVFDQKVAEINKKQEEHIKQVKQLSNEDLADQLSNF